MFILSIPFSTKSPKNLVGLPYDTVQRVQTPGRELLLHGSLPSSCISVLAAKVIGKVPGGPGTHCPLFIKPQFGVLPRNHPLEVLILPWFGHSWRMLSEASFRCLVLRVAMWEAIEPSRGSSGK